MNNILEKVRGLPATVILSIVILTILLGILFAWAPVLTGLLLLAIASLASIIRLAVYLSEGR
jgi:hypothetical protein